MFKRPWTGTKDIKEGARKIEMFDALNNNTAATQSFRLGLMTTVVGFLATNNKMILYKLDLNSSNRISHFKKMQRAF